MFAKEIIVRFGECDGLGHVNNVVYFEYMEDARSDVFRLFNPALELKDWNLIVASARCEFLQQIKYAEKIRVYTWFGRLGQSSFDVEHGLQNELGVWVARGQATMIHYDYKLSKSTSIPLSIRVHMDEHRTAPEGVPALRG